MSETPLLGLPLIESAQAQKHVTHNEALLLLDAAVHLAVITRGLATPPGSPLDGDRYLVAAGATGAWASHSGELAFREAGIWRFATPREGWRLWVADEDIFLVFDGVAWRDIQAISTLQNMALLGVNTTADATNKLAVKSLAILFDNVGNGTQVKVNKAAAGDTASFMFQTNYSGRAEIGLTGDDNFHFKVSPDGSSWLEAILINRTTGAVSTPQTPVLIANITPTDAGFWLDENASVRLWRMRDRIFLGDAADTSGNFTGTQGSWLALAADGANWAPRSSQLMVMSSNGLMAITGAVRSSDQDGTHGTAAIGVAGFCIGNKAGVSARAFYGDVQHEAGVTSYGLELAVKNKSASNNGTTAHLQVFDTCGIWMAAGGDNSYGGSAVNPSSVGIAVGAGSSTWNAGIVFFTGALANNPSTGFPVAISMAQNHRIHWGMPGNFTGAAINSSVATDGKGTFQTFADDVVRFSNGANLTTFQISHIASGVNGIDVKQSVAGVSPLISSFGADTNIDIKMRGKGTGSVLLQDSAAVTKFAANSTGIGFFATTPVAKPAVTGTRVDPAGALNSLLTSLSNLGLITNSSTAGTGAEAASLINFYGRHMAAHMALN